MVEVLSRVKTLKRLFKVARMIFGDPSGFCDKRLGGRNEVSRFSST
jgi:hypothetical protein